MRFFIIFSSILFFTNIQSQNLIPNSSFENYKKCPKKLEQINKTYFWNSPTKGTPDYYNSCNVNSVSVPKNNFGFQHAKTGNAYVGIYGYSSYSYSSEYIQIKLDKELQKDSIYLLCFYISLSEKSDYSIDKIGAYFSDNEIHKNFYGILDYTPQIYSNNILDDKNNWTLISGYYKAKGSEKYLIIGNFFKSNEIQIINTKINPKNKYAYYYIDDVSLVQVEENDSIRKILNPPKKQAQRNILKNVNFESNKSELLPESHTILDTLAYILIKNENLQIELYGHTDSTGQEIDNYALSVARAESVLNYLVQKGVSRVKLTAIGLGSSEPIAPNNTKEGRLTNRRVEFVIIDNSMKYR